MGFIQRPLNCIIASGNAVILLEPRRDRFCDMSTSKQVAASSTISTGSTARAADESETAVGASGRLPALDGARGLAILAVMLFHFSAAGAEVAGDTWLDEVIDKVLGIGWAGVDLFFVLSGFLITGLLLNAKGTAGYFRHFYARRSLRIWPAMYVLLVLLMVLVPFVAAAGREPTREVAQRILWYASFTINFVMAFETELHQDFGLAGHLWSIAVEEQFYLVWPFVVLLLGRRALLAACCSMIVGALVIRVALETSAANDAGAFLLMPSRMDALAVGALVAVFVHDPIAMRTMRRWAPWIAPAAIAVLAVLFVALGDLTPPLEGWTQTIGLSALAMLFGTVLVYVISSNKGNLAHRALVSTPLMWLGKYSYALYLFHVPTGTILAWKLQAPLRELSVYGSFLFGQIVFVLIAGAISLALAWLSWRLLEEPFLRAKTLFPYGSEASGQRLSM